MKKNSTIAYLLIVGMMFMLSASCTHRATPKSARVDKTRKLKCRCGKPKVPQKHYQVIPERFM